MIELAKREDGTLDVVDNCNKQLSTHSEVEGNLSSLVATMKKPFDDEANSTDVMTESSVSANITSTSLVTTPSLNATTDQTTELVVPPTATHNGEISNTIATSLSVTMVDQITESMKAVNMDWTPPRKASIQSSDGMYYIPSSPLATMESTPPRRRSSPGCSIQSLIDDQGIEYGLGL